MIYIDTYQMDNQGYIGRSKGIDVLHATVSDGVKF